MPTSVDFEPLRAALDSLTAEVVEKIESLRGEATGANANLSVAKMFELQLAMTNLESVSSMSTSVVSAMNSSIQGMTRNLGK